MITLNLNDIQNEEFYNQLTKLISIYLILITGLPHTQGKSGNFQVEENLRESQRILIYFLNSGKF